MAEATESLKDQVAEGTAPPRVLESEAPEGHTTGPVRRTQAGYRAARDAVKAAAAPVVEKNAKDAEAAKKRAQAKRFTVKGTKEFNSEGAAMEAQIAERRAERAKAKAEATK